MSRDQWRPQPVASPADSAPPVRVLMAGGKWLVPLDERPTVLPAPGERRGPDIVPYLTYTKGERR